MKDFYSKFTGEEIDSLLEKVKEGEVSGGVTILLPNDSTFASDVANEEFLAHNRETYAKLYAQADKELSVSMRYFGHNILCNPTMRVRFVDDGVNPYYDYCYVLLNGNLIETGQAYRLYSDGKVAKIKFNGDIIIDVNGKLNEEIAAEILHGEEVVSPAEGVTLSRSNYTQSRESSSAALGTKWQPYIAMNGTQLMVGNLFGSNSDDEFLLTGPASWDKETNIVTVSGGWTHPLFGPIDSDIQFNFDPITQTLTTVEETITLAGWATITGYKLTRTNFLSLREDNLTEYLANKVDKEDVATINGQSILNGGNIEIEGGGESYDDTELRGLIADKQDRLVSGTNIKTINGESVLGEGNIEIQGGGLVGEVVSSTEPTDAFPQVLYVEQTLTEEQKSVARRNIGVSEAIEEAIAEIPAPESSVFEAIYGETTFEEIVEAYNAKKHVLCIWNDRVYNLSAVTSTLLNFSCTKDSVIYIASCKNDNVWGNLQYNVEHVRNKATTISASSTEAQYPSAKAVYDFMQNSITNVLNEEV